MAVGHRRSRRSAERRRLWRLVASVAATVCLAAAGASSGPAWASTNAATDAGTVSNSSVHAASVLSCPGYSQSRLPAAVGVAAVNIGGCPGYWVADSSGQVAAYGSARYHGGLDDPGAHIVGITGTSDGGGYWLVGANGAVYTFGDAPYYGGASSYRLSGAILSMSITQDGKGYWLVASDGGIFSFGDARFFGSMGGRHLNKPVDGMAVAPGGKGYWLVAQDGGVFTFTTDGFYGSAGNVRLNRPIIGMSGTSDGRGYTLVASDGGVFNFGDSRFYGSLGADPPLSAVVDLSPCPGNNGYYLLDAAGQVFPFGPGAEVPAQLELRLPAVPTATVGSPYRLALGASGGTAPYRWTASGALPPGLSLAASGVISGSASQTGTYTFDATITDSGRPQQSISTAITIGVDPRPVTGLQITTAGLPTAEILETYEATMTATGGTGPYTWSIESGALPTGLSLSSTGQISGAPTETGTFSFTAQVQDAAGHTTTASLGVVVAVSTGNSSNWSGYAVGSGPFTGAAGTFTVPYLTNASQAGEDMSEWVGIDGVANSSLIQAGVELTPDPASQTFYVQPWWEVLPAPETPITTMSVSPGDTVTVSINQVAGTSTWAISLEDDTNGQSFSTDQVYSGPADSAEWIVEAPTIDGFQSSMAPYSPNVLFSDLQTSQAGTAAVRIVLIDPYSGEQTSTPSGLDSNGFAVAYGPDAPPAP